MKVLHINTHYRAGGAARAMKRLHSQLILKGHRSKFLVGRGAHEDSPQVHVMVNVMKEHRDLWGSLFSLFGNRLRKLWGPHPWAFRPTLKLPKTELYKWADIIDLRNLFGGYFNIWVLPELSANKPVVWRIPDMWAITGHCAFSYDCQRWISGCYNCPLLSGQGRKIVEPPATYFDGTDRVWSAKKDLYSRSKLHVVVNSEWMRRNVEKSILGKALSINVISNGVDLDIYKPYEKERVRKEFGLPLKRNIVIFSAARLSSYRKGYHYAKGAINDVQKSSDSPLLITMGNLRGIELKNNPAIRHFGFVGDPEKQAKLYAASDLFLCTTLADSQPQTALESIACGTPVLSFNIGPMPDIVGEKSHGYVSENISIEALCEAMTFLLDRPNLLSDMGIRCRNKAERDYDLDSQSEKYIELYRGILTQSCA